VRQEGPAAVAVSALLDVAELAVLESGPRSCPAPRPAPDTGNRRAVGPGLARLADRPTPLATAPRLAEDGPGWTARRLAGGQVGVGGVGGAGTDTRASTAPARRIAGRPGAAATDTLPVRRQGRGHPVLLRPARSPPAQSRALACKF